MNKLLYFFLLALAIGVNGKPSGETETQTQPEIDCDAKLIESDKCFEKAVVFANPVIYNTTEEVEEEFCGTLLESVRCMRDYKHCLTAFPRQVYNMLMFNLKKVSKNICETAESRSEFVNHLKCFSNKPVDELTLNDLSEMTTENLDYTAGLEGEEMIQNLCCGQHVAIREGRMIIAEECNDNSTVDFFMENLSQGILEDATDMICGNYDSYDVCQEKVPQVVAYWAMKVKKHKKVLVTTTVDGVTTSKYVPFGFSAEKRGYTALTPIVTIIKKLTSEMSLPVARPATS